jgi:DNA-binding beta-propeller fold protein YncE
MRDCPETVGTICPWAGAGYNGWNGDDVHRLDAWFSYPMSVTFSPYGATMLSDWNNHKLRIVKDNPEDGFETIMGTNFLGDGDPDLKDSTEAGAQGTTVNLNHPTQQMYFPDGTLLSASWHTHKLRTWDPNTGLVHVYVGSAPGFSGIETDDPADTALLNQPKQALISTLDPNLVYILDMRNERIRLLNISDWTLTTIAGNGEKDYCGDGMPALETCFNFPMNANPEPGGGLALNADETLLYILDTESHILRVLDLQTGIIDLLAGSPGELGDVDGDGATARFYNPTSLAIDHTTGELFIADANNHKVRVFDTATGMTSTYAGTGAPSCELEELLIPVVCDNQHDGGDGGPATQATLYRPFGVDLNLDGDLVISDTYNQRFRIIYR